MSISIIFPIEVGDNGAPVTNTSSSRVTSTSFELSFAGGMRQMDYKTKFKCFY